MNLPDPSASDLTPSCPLKNSSCSCNNANADPSTYSDLYKQWLLWNAEGQMTSFEIGWGWFYWTWITESATQWSWKLGMEAGILPQKVWDRQFNCSQTIPNFAGLPESY
jgi:glucan 1,3-beta-glucosidase